MTKGKRRKVPAVGRKQGLRGQLSARLVTFLGSMRARAVLRCYWPTALGQRSSRIGVCAVLLGNQSARVDYNHLNSSKVLTRQAEHFGRGLVPPVSSICIRLVHIALSKPENFQTICELPFAGLLLASFLKFFLLLKPERISCLQGSGSRPLVKICIALCNDRISSARLALPAQSAPAAVVALR